jgi:hypothetical protein
MGRGSPRSSAARSTTKSCTTSSPTFRRYSHLSSPLLSSSPALTKRVTQTHYPEIAPIVRKTCEEYEVPYVVLPSFWVALKAHLHYLMVMGGAPDLH